MISLKDMSLQEDHYEVNLPNLGCLLRVMSLSCVLKGSQHRFNLLLLLNVLCSVSVGSHRLTNFNEQATVK